MDESGTYPDVEVFWDCDSPTPSVWSKLQQGSRRIVRNQHSSPQLVQTKRREALHGKTTCDNQPEIVQSRRKVDQIISALSMGSKTRNVSPTSSVATTNKLVIPMMSDEGDSEDENCTTIPLFDGSNQRHASIDFLLEDSGENADMASNVKCEKKMPVTPKLTSRPQISLREETWDDSFADEILISEMDRIPSTTPAKMKKTAPMSSTPLEKVTKKRTMPSKYQKKVLQLDFDNDDASRSTTTSRTANDFLNYVFNDNRSDKGSLGKQKSDPFKKCEFNTKMVQGECRPLTKTSKCTNAVKEKSHDLIVKRNQNSCNSDESVGVKFSDCLRNQDVKSNPIDTSIPLDILEELIEESSWSDESPKRHKDKPDVDHFIPGQQSDPKSSTSKVPSLPKPRTDPVEHSGVAQTCLMPVIHPSRRTNPSNVETHSKRLKVVSNIIAHSSVNKGGDGFSSDDEDVLLEAIALSESSQLSKVSAPFKCTESEIQLKKERAMQRRMLTLKKGQSSRC